MSFVLRLIILFTILPGVKVLLAQSSGTLLSLEKSFQDQVSGVPQEKVFVHTDKSVYAVGETIWMQLYCYDPGFHTLSQLSSFVNVEIISGDGEPVFQERIRLKEGLGPGQIFIGAHVPSGVYVLRAYTRWMMNGSGELFFEKPIAILNAAIPPAMRKTELPDHTGKSTYHIFTENSDGKISLILELRDSPEEVFCLVESGGVLRYSVSGKKQDGKFRFLFSMENLAIGDNQVSFWNKEKKLLASTSIRRETPLQKNIGLSMIKDRFLTREKVRIKLQNLTESTALLSVSVYKTIPEAAFKNADIQTEFYTYANPGIWDFLQSRQREYLPEIKAAVVQGTVGQEIRGRKLSQFYLSFPGAQAGLYPVFTDQEGRFTVDIMPGQKSGDMLFWSEKMPFSANSVQLLPTFSEAPLNYRIPEFLSEDYRTLASSLYLNSQIGHLYTETSQIRGIPSAASDYLLPFYGKPFISYELDEFTRFPSLDEVFLEYIRYASRNREGGKTYIRLMDEYPTMQSSMNNYVFDSAALAMIDGVPMIDPNPIWDFDVFKIRKIDIVPKKYLCGNHFFKGVINFETYKHNFGGNKLPPGLSRHTWRGIQQPVSFYSPVYDQNLRYNHLPDFRSTLFWKPDIILNEEDTFSFFTSDDTGEYTVEINGITRDGFPVHLTQTFSVSHE